MMVHENPECNPQLPTLPEVPPGNDYASAFERLVTELGITNPAEIQLLQNNGNIFVAINNYLNANNWSQDSRDFGKWAVEYLYEFPDADVNELITNNNILNSNINLPILDTSALTNYPAFKALVEDLPNFLNSYPNVLKALEITTGMKQKKIKELMQPGKGPKVRVINNLKDEYGNNAIGQYDDLNKVLKIDKDYVSDLSKANTPIKYKGLGLILTITTLHEFVHYGRDINNLPKRMAGLKTGKGSFEAGVYFEDIIMPPGASPLEPPTAHGWLRYYNIKYRE